MPKAKTTKTKTKSATIIKSPPKAKPKAVKVKVVKLVSKKLVQATFARERVITEASDLARELYNQGAFGTVLEDGKIQLSLTEALFLLEKKKSM